MNTGDPHSEYSRRLQERQAELRRHERLHVQIGNLRLAVALLFAWAAFAAFSQHAVAPWLPLVPLAGFVALGISHEVVLRRKQRAERAIRYYEQAIARLEDRWIGTGQTGERFRDATHPYSEDIDLFGRGGLFELLSSARTRAGEETLARWLLHAASPEEIRERQKAVDELRGKLDLREDLAVLGEEIGAGVHPAALIAWAEQPRRLPDGWVRAAAVLISVTVLATAVLLPFKALLAALALPAGFGLWLRNRVLMVAREAESASHDLALLASVLHRLEREPFVSPRLAELRKALDSEGDPPSRRIARLNRLMELVDSRDNLFMRLIGPPLLYTTHLAFALEAWRVESGAAVRRWIEAVGEMEALSALAGYAYEHPADPFPQILPGAASFDAEGLGHPLLPESRMIRNDVRLGGDVRVFVVSGSNMSGKSTLLRSVGVNVVMAMAGAPVRAKRLQLGPLSLGASIRVVDSLQGGTSRFYAEITRIRRIVDLASGDAPLIFLLDELLHGTNSHDRRIGATAIVHGLVERNAIGLITTHDLALTHIVTELDGRGVNVHFEDHLENGQMQFDYRLQPGVVQKSNALELMRSVGLEV